MNLQITIPETWQTSNFEEWMYNLEQKLKNQKL